MCGSSDTEPAKGSDQFPQEFQDDSWDHELGDSDELRHHLEQAQHGLAIAKHIVGLVSGSSDLDLVAKVAVQLYFTEGDRFGLNAAPLLERLEAVMADGELPAQALTTLHSAFGSEGVFDEGDLATAPATARTQERLLPGAPAVVGRAD